MLKPHLTRFVIDFRTHVLTATAPTDLSKLSRFANDSGRAFSRLLLLREWFALKVHYQLRELIIFLFPIPP